MSSNKFENYKNKEISRMLINNMSSMSSSSHDKFKFVIYFMFLFFKLLVNEIKARIYNFIFNMRILENRKREY